MIEFAFQSAWLRKSSDFDYPACPVVSPPSAFLPPIIVIVPPMPPSVLISIICPPDHVRSVVPSSLTHSGIVISGTTKMTTDREGGRQAVGPMTAAPYLSQDEMVVIINFALMVIKIHFKCMEFVTGDIYQIFTITPMK